MSSDKKVNIFEMVLPGTGQPYNFTHERLPEQKTSNQTDWVIFGTQDHWKNQQPQYYDYLSKMSSKNGAILGAKDRYVWGKGFKVDDTGLAPPDKIEIRGFINNPHMKKLFRRIISDRNKYGGFAVEMIPNKGGDRVIPHYIPFKNVRVGKKEYDKEGELLPTRYFFTSNWNTTKQKILSAPDFTEFEAWPWDEEKVNSSTRYLIYFKDEGFEDEAYPLPDYQGGVPYIDADTEVGNFVYNNVRNGFTSGLLVQFFNGDPGEDQKRELEQMWHNYLHGSDNAGKAMMAWLNSHDEEVKVTPLAPNGQDDRYTTLNGQICDEVFIAHTMSPMVVGMTGENGFSNNADEKRVAIESFNEDFVSHTQETFNEFANELLSYNEIKGHVELQRLDPIMAQFSEQTLTQIATSDELREMAGLPKAETEANKVADALATISPLVATKVLEVMTTAEIRGLVGLPGASGLNKITKEVISEFSSEIKDELFIKHFEKTGILDEELEILDSMELFATDIEDAEMKGLMFRHETFQSPVEKTILTIISTNPNATNERLSKLLGITEEEVEEIIEGLSEDGLVDENGDITAAGQEVVAEEAVFTVYKYEKRADVSGPSIIDGTREFCKSLVRQSAFKSWTIDDIKLMDNGMGLDVFTSRGGWRTLEGTDVHVPFCRHIWKAVLVRRQPT